MHGRAWARMQALKAAGAHRAGEIQLVFLTLVLLQILPVLSLRNALHSRVQLHRSQTLAGWWAPEQQQQQKW